MSIPSRHSSRALAFLVAGLLGASSGCGGGNGDGGPLAPVITTVPASWGGIWSVHVTVTACNTSVALFDTTVVDTLCPGTSVANLLDTGDSTFCQDAVVRGTETRVSYSCTEHFSDSGCNLAVGLTMNGVFDPGAGTSTATGRLAIDASPEGPECFDLCLDIRQTGTRLAPTPAECPAVSPGALRRALAGRSLRNLAPR